MARKFTLIMLLLTVAFLHSFSQRRASGEVFAEDNNLPLAFATVLVITEPDSTFAGGTTTDMNGLFELTVPQNADAYLVVRMVGYAHAEKIGIPSGNSDVVLARIFLKEDATLLNDVIVNGEKPVYEVLPDRIVVNVASSVSFSGRSALQVLQQTPGVIVNPNGTIVANGRSGVSIMLNGRIVKLSSEMAGSFLEGLSASTIEKIELIRTPDAGVDAEGEAGVINIVTKDQVARGFRGSVFSTAGYSWKPKAGFGGNGTYAGDRLLVAAQYSFNRNYTTSHWDNFFHYTTETDKVAIASYNVRHESNTDQAFTFQTDYRVTDKTTVGANFIMNIRDHGYQSGKPATVTTLVTRNDVIQDYSESTYAERNRWDQYVGNVNVGHQLNKRASVSADLDYLYSENNIPVSYGFRFFEDDRAVEPLRESTMRSKKTTPISTYAFKLDYTHSLKAGSTVAAGLKYTTNRFYNTFDVDSLWNSQWIRDEGSSSRYRYNEKIPAAYVSSKVILSPKDELSAGLRYESTQMDIIAGEHDRKRTFTSLFPNVTLTRNIVPGKKSLTATFSRRINRPGYWDLAPFAIFLGPNVFVAGNESLRPSLNNSATFTYTGATFSYTLTGNYNQFTIANYQVRLAEEDNMLRANAQNLRWSKNAHINISMPATSVMRGWETLNSVTVFGEKISAHYPYASSPTERNLVGFRVSSNNTFLLPRAWKIELNGYYNSSTFAGTSRHLGFGMLTAGIGKQVKGFVFNLNASDLLWTWRWNRITEEKESAFRSEMNYRLEPRVVTLTLRRNLGNERVRSAGKRSTASEDEQRRM